MKSPGMHEASSAKKEKTKKQHTHPAHTSREEHLDIIPNNCFHSTLKYDNTAQPYHPFFYKSLN